MEKKDLLAYLIKLDEELSEPTILYIYGSAVLILLDEPERISMDIDVAASYSRVNFAALQTAAEKIGLPINPDHSYSGNHIEWIQSLRLCLAPPKEETSQILWQGKHLTIKTTSIIDLIASKLIRYDEMDQTDIHFLFKQTRFTFSSIEEAVTRLPDTFRNDVLIKENLRNLKEDIGNWEIKQ